ncbi:hypothetical protein ABZX51_012210 [Aspergillus tubingensis]
MIFYERRMGYTLYSIFLPHLVPRTPALTMSLMSIMPEELKSLLLATAKRRTHLASASSTIPYLRTGYHQQQGVHLLADAPVLEQN